MGGSSSKAKEAKEKEKDKEKGPKQSASQQHRVTPVAKKPPDATARSTPQPSPRQAATAPAAAPPSGTASTARPSTLESPGHSNNSLLDECASEWTVSPLAQCRLSLAWRLPGRALQAPGRATHAGGATEPPPASRPGPTGRLRRGRQRLPKRLPNEVSHL